jgi:hypothetical protein
MVRRSPAAMSVAPSFSTVSASGLVRFVWSGSMIETTDAPVRVRTWRSRMVLPTQAAPGSMANHSSTRSSRTTSAIGRLRGT